MRNTIMLACVTSTVLLAACTAPAPRLEAGFGNAVKAAVAQQTLNPEASLNTDPVAGIDGRAAKNTIERYEASFKTPPAPVNVFNIGVGSSGGR